ncbi:MAG: potassium channel family protein [Akkermansiaceae bacterium]
MPLLSQFTDKVGRHTLLLLCLIATMVGLPLLEDLPIGRILLSAWFLVTSGVVLASLSGSGRGHRILVVAGGIFCAMLLGNLVVEAMGRDSQALQMIALPYGVLFLAWVSGLILFSILHAQRVTPDLISGAVVAYMLLGICWGGLYIFLEILNEGSFSFGDGGRELTSLFYYSFVTLTTLGYGDILPVGKVARTAAYLEAVTGVMFTAILIAGLVGKVRLQREKVDPPASE